MDCHDGLLEIHLYIGTPSLASGPEHTNMPKATLLNTEGLKVTPGIPTRLDSLGVVRLVGGKRQENLCQGSSGETVCVSCVEILCAGLQCTGC